MSNRQNRKPTAAARARDARVQQSHAAQRSSRVPWILAGVAVVVVIVLVVAFALTRKGDSSASTGGSSTAGTVVTGGLSYGKVKVSGTQLPELQPGGLDAAAGQTVPTLTGSTMSEAPITIGNDGKPKVVMFLAHWCPHCQAEVPRIQEWLNQNGQPSDVALYAVATGTSDQKPNFPPSKWLKKEDWTVPTMVDDEKGSAAQAYGLSSFPFFVVVGADGKVVARTSGELTTEQFEALLAQARGTGAGGTVPQSPAASPGGSSPAPRP